MAEREGLIRGDAAPPCGAPLRGVPTGTAGWSNPSLLTTEGSNTGYSTLKKVLRGVAGNWR